MCMPCARWAAHLLTHWQQMEVPKVRYWLGRDGGGSDMIRVKTRLCEKDSHL